MVIDNVALLNNVYAKMGLDTAAPADKQQVAKTNVFGNIIVSYKKLPGHKDDSDIKAVKTFSEILRNINYKHPNYDVAKLKTIAQALEKDQSFKSLHYGIRANVRIALEETKGKTLSFWEQFTIVFGEFMTSVRRAVGGPLLRKGEKGTTTTSFLTELLKAKGDIASILDIADIRDHNTLDLKNILDSIKKRYLAGSGEKQNVQGLIGAIIKENIKEVRHALDEIFFEQEYDVHVFKQALDVIPREFSLIKEGMPEEEKEKCLATIKANLNWLSGVYSFHKEEINKSIESFKERMEKLIPGLVTKEYVKLKLNCFCNGAELPEDKFFTYEVVEAFGKIFLEFEARSVLINMLEKDVKDKRISDREFLNVIDNDFTRNTGQICEEFLEKLKELAKREKELVESEKELAESKKVEAFLNDVEDLVNLEADMILIEKGKSYLKAVGFEGTMPADKYFFSEQVREVSQRIFENFEEVEESLSEKEAKYLFEEIDEDLSELAEKDLRFLVKKAEVNDAKKAEVSDAKEAELSDVEIRTLGLTAEDVKNSIFDGSLVFGEVIKFLKDKMEKSKANFSV